MLRVAQLIQTIDVTAGGTSTAFLATLAAVRTRANLAVHVFCRRPANADDSWNHINANPGDFTLADGLGSALRKGLLTPKSPGYSKSFSDGSQCQRVRQLRHY